MVVPVKFVLFDCEGTLADTFYMNIAILKQTFARVQKKCPDESELRKVMMLPFSVMFEKLGFKGYEIGELAEMARKVNDEMRFNSSIAQPAYEGVPELLRDLSEQGYVLGIATGRSRRTLDLWLQEQNLANYFVTLQTPDTCRSKPHPDMALKAMDAVGAEPEDTVVIGDTSYDVVMAKDARAHSIGVSWGADPGTHLVSLGARSYVDTADQLIEEIEKAIGKAA